MSTAISPSAIAHAPIVWPVCSALGKGAIVGLMTWQGTWAHALRRICAFGKAPDPSDTRETASFEVWRSWLWTQRLQPFAFGVLGYVMGPVDSGRHRLARSLARHTLDAGEVCVWLGAGRPQGMWTRPRPAAARPKGVLVWGRASCDATAFGMLDIVLDSRMATTVVVVLQGAPDAAGLGEAGCASLVRIEAAARRQGACVLVLGPPVPTDARQTWPKWHLVPASGRRL